MRLHFLELVLLVLLRFLLLGVRPGLLRLDQQLEIRREVIVFAGLDLVLLGIIQPRSSHRSSRTSTVPASARSAQYFPSLSVLSVKIRPLSPLTVTVMPTQGFASLSSTWPETRALCAEVIVAHNRIAATRDHRLCESCSSVSPPR